MKMLFKKLKSKCVALSLVVGLTLTGCGETSKRDGYNTQEYAIVYVDGTPHFVQVDTAIINKITGRDILNFYDVNTYKMVGKFVKHEDVTLSNDIGSCVTEFSVIPLSEILETNSFTNETYQFFAHESEKVDQFIEENYPYDVIFSEKSELGIYEFIDKISGKESHHLGYDANRMHIYDIRKGKVYRKPDAGCYTFVPISDLYDGDTITIKQATEIMDNYINEKVSKSTDSKKEDGLLDKSQITLDPTENNVDSSMITNISEPTEDSIDSPTGTDEVSTRNNTDSSHTTAKEPIKKEKINHIDLKLINAQLIDDSIDQKYYLVKEKKTSSHTKCKYNSAKNTDMICYSETFVSTDEKNPATFVRETHYSELFRGNSYLCMKANINGQKYEKVYKLVPGTIDHNPDNLEKVERFENTAIDLNEVLEANNIDSKDYYSTSDIRKLNSQVSKRKRLKR